MSTNHPPRRSPRIHPSSPLTSPQKAVSNTHTKVSKGLPDSMKLLIGATGIYTSFLYYGLLYEDVFNFRNKGGEKFKHVWFLQACECLMNVVVGVLGGGIGRGGWFGVSGVSQVVAKVLTSLSLSHGLSFPIATLAKSCKLLPVLLGSLLLGNARYTPRDYLQILAIIIGTCIVSLGSKKSPSESSTIGVLCILGSLLLDGVTAGIQKRLKGEMGKRGVKMGGFSMMMWTNVWMGVVCMGVGGLLGELGTGWEFVRGEKEVLEKIVKFSLCSALGQSFVFYTISNFDPLLLSTITTTRKILSVIMSIFLKGHSLSSMGWLGIALSCGGVLSELTCKFGKGSKKV